MGVIPFWGSGNKSTTTTKKQLLNVDSENVFISSRNIHALPAYFFKNCFFFILKVR